MTREEAVAAAGAIYAAALAEQDEQTPREAAEAAYLPGGPSIDELENRVRARRGLPAASQRGVA